MPILDQPQAALGETDRPGADRPTIVQALATWSHWHADCGPLGATGNYALDMALADAFRALLYRPSLRDRLNWLYREAIMLGDARPVRYRAELIRWWLDLYETEKVPIIESRLAEREREPCAIF